jgi:hypothetical protein
LPTLLQITQEFQEEVRLFPEVPGLQQSIQPTVTEILITTAEQFTVLRDLKVSLKQEEQ